MEAASMTEVTPNTTNLLFLQETLAEVREQRNDWRGRCQIASRSSAEWEKRYNALAKAARWVSDCWGRKDDEWIRSDMDEAIRALRHATPRPSPLVCECSHWAREGPTEEELTEHHPHCVWAD
jgi:hypothetical protein